MLGKCEFIHLTNILTFTVTLAFGLGLRLNKWDRFDLKNVWEEITATNKIKVKKKKITRLKLEQSSNKNSLILKKRHLSTQGVYEGEQIKNENYKSQVIPKEKKNGFSTQRTSQVRFGKNDIFRILASWIANNPTQPKKNKRKATLLI